MGLQEPSPPRKLSPSNNYLKYGGLGIQLLIAIGVSGWLGYKLDAYLKIKFPAFMLLFGFAAFGGMIYQLYRSLKKDNP